MRNFKLALTVLVAGLWPSFWGSLAADTSTDRTALRNAVLAGNYTPRYVEGLSRSLCPQICSDTGIDDASGWFQYHSTDRLSLCNATMLLDFQLTNSLNDPDTRVNIAACTADLVSSKTTATKDCVLDGVQQSNVTLSLQLASSDATSQTLGRMSNLVDALTQMRAHSMLKTAGCDETILFSQSGDIAVGVYVGSGLAGQRVVPPVLDQLSAYAQSVDSLPENLVVQLCHNTSARYSMGIFTNANGDLGAVQLGLQKWKNGTCVSDMQAISPAWQNITFTAPSQLHLSSESSQPVPSVFSNSTIRQRSRNPVPLRRDGDCTTEQVVAGDSCATLAAECGITAAEFDDYNPSSSLCSSLVVGQHVCCTAGDLPDFAPQPSSDGSCYSYLVVTGDSCSALAATYDITLDDLESWNSNTWGWTGCSDLLVGYNICLSSGYAPMPAPVLNAECGPQVNGTVTAPPGTNMSSLNECPLNACCDIWGQCGTTAEFCTISNSATLAPGTAAPGQNGCISNCGTEIIQSDAPATTYKIGYFEGFDWSRPCEAEGVEDVDVSSYTHIHFAFGTINADWTINITSVQSQFPFFRALQGVKKILSIGGWAFSTDADTYQIFRDVVSSETSRATLISNVLDFLNDNDLDGVDWDWECQYCPFL